MNNTYGDWVSFQGDESVLKLEMTIAQQQEHIKCHCIEPSKMVKFMFYKFTSIKKKFT